jgi:hypothetical protein
LNHLIGDRSAPEGCIDYLRTSVQARSPVSGVFPADGWLHLLEIRIQAIKL